MFKMLKKFFDFCSRENRSKFYKSVALGVLDAMCTAMKIPAAFLAIGAVLSGTIDTKSILAVVALMLISTIGKMVVNRFSQMMQTEAGYNTAAGKRIEIGEHLRYLPMGYFNDTSLGHITSVTTNSMEQLGDIATRAVMMILQGGITTIVISIGLFVFNLRIALISMAGIAVFFVVNHFTNVSVARVAGEKIEADKDMVGVVLEYIQGIAEIRNYNLAKQEGGRLAKAIERKTKADIKAETAAIPLVGLQNLVSKLTGVAIAGASVFFCLNKTMDIKYTITMLLCAFILFESLDLAGVYTALLRIIGKCVDLANEILEIPQMDIDGEDILPANRDIHLEHVSFAYENRKIIDDVSLDIKENT
ncbi:MAG: ABC transporter ATP-binding protein/permease, partial [Lachnospiraceae bacterium]|nr:ABC transporter ATP-binding protein/permease [Lachnospiraceae bacterium]